jgi:hypothetical protein
MSSAQEHGEPEVELGEQAEARDHPEKRPELRIVPLEYQE